MLYCVFIFNFYFVVVYLIGFYMWLRVLRSRKVAIYSDGNNIIIIIVVVCRPTDKSGSSKRKCFGGQ